MDPVGPVGPKQLRTVNSSPDHHWIYSKLNGCLEVLKKVMFLYMNLSDYASRQTGPLLKRFGVHFKKSPAEGRIEYGAGDVDL